MGEGTIATILAFIVYLSTALFGGGEQAVQPGFPQAPPATESRQQFYPRRAVVTAKAVNLRGEPSVDAQVLAVLPEGDSLTIRQEKDGWYQVTGDGQTGWVRKWTLQPESKGENSREVMGYYAESYSGDPRAMRSLTGNLGIITTVAPFSYRIDREGNIHGQTGPDLLKTAQTNGLKTLAVVTNIQGTNFSREAVSGMLSSKSARQKAIAGILNLLKSNGYSGVNIDFEGVPSRDRLYLTAFFRELASVLRPHNYLVTAALPAKTEATENSSWAGAFDFSALAPYLDWAVIMTYDQHQANSSPGPVAALEWVERAVAYSLQHFSADRLIMGVPAYGYAWNNRSGRALNYTGIQSLIERYRITPKWHDRYQAPFFTYTDGGTKYEVWFENRHSTAAKMRLVEQYNLRGVAVWRLGYEDPGIWEVLG
jgi:spore germination protein YaaH